MTEFKRGDNVKAYYLDADGKRVPLGRGIAVLAEEPNEKGEALAYWPHNCSWSELEVQHCDKMPITEVLPEDEGKTL